MSEAGLFIGWSAPVRGRETKSLGVFQESVEFWGRLQQEGRIDDFEIVFLAPHGGDLAGFALIRGSRDQMAQLRADEDFERITVRATMVVEGFGVVDAALGDTLGRQVELFQAAAEEFS